MTKLFAFTRYIGSRFFYPFLWTLIIIGLLCIPGKSLPGLGIFGFKHFDKFIHIILFGGFVLLWGIYAWSKKDKLQNWPFLLAVVILLSLAIGVVMEFIQAAYIPQRSFDVWDIWSDLVGSLLFGFILFKWGGRWKLLV